MILDIKFRTEPGGGYTWHTDFNIIKPLLTIVVYVCQPLYGILMISLKMVILNLLMVQIQPERGKLRIFPYAGLFIIVDILLKVKQSTLPQVVIQKIQNNGELFSESVVLQAGCQELNLLFSTQS